AAPGHRGAGPGDGALGDQGGCPRRGQPRPGPPRADDPTPPVPGSGAGRGPGAGQRGRRAVRDPAGRPARVVPPPGLLPQVRALAVDVPSHAPLTSRGEPHAVAARPTSYGPVRSRLTPALPPHIGGRLTPPSPPTGEDAPPEERTPGPGHEPPLPAAVGL